MIPPLPLETTFRTRSRGLMAQTLSSMFALRSKARHGPAVTKADSDEYRDCEQQDCAFGQRYPFTLHAGWRRASPALRFKSLAMPAGFSVLRTPFRAPPRPDSHSKV
jgi:hypothetical protein